MPVLDRLIDIPLPKGWSQRVRSGAIHAISLARFSLTAARGHAAHSWNAKIRLGEENDRLGVVTTMPTHSIRRATNGCWSKLAS